jgi:hypothetical protein
MIPYSHVMSPTQRAFMEAVRKAGRAGYRAPTGEGFVATTRHRTADSLERRSMVRLVSDGIAFWAFKSDGT